MRSALAYLSGALLIAGGGALLSRKYERAGALLLAAFYGFWVVALHLPHALRLHGHIGAWNAPPRSRSSPWERWRCSPRSRARCAARSALVARLLAGVSALVFGLAHFNYIDFTATFVPGWIPPTQVSGPGPRARATSPAGWRWSAVSRRGWR